MKLERFAVEAYRMHTPSGRSIPRAEQALQSTAGASTGVDSPRCIWRWNRTQPFSSISRMTH